MAFFEQDFIMRQVQHLIQLLQQILFKKKQNKHNEAVEQIQDAFKELTKKHPKSFSELSLSETLRLFIRNDQFETDLALAVADLLVEEGELLSEKQFSKAQKCNLQALLLYKRALKDESAALPLDIRNKINELEQRIAPSDKLDKSRKILGE